MTVVRVVYERLFNLGNYESERLTMEASVEGEQDPVEVLTELRERVNATHAAFDARREEERQAEEERRRAEFEARRTARAQSAPGI
jgi:hypothetical protein